MAGEKAKENKTLTATCGGCGKTMSTELLTGVLVGRAPHRQLVPACQPCLDRGWSPVPDTDELDAANPGT